MGVARRLPILLVLAVACGGRSQSRPGSVASVGGDVIYTDELLHTNSSDLLTALQRLRPNWFRRSPMVVRGQGDLLVYVDGVAQGGTSILRSIPVSAVLVAKYFSPSEAQATFGAGPLYGAIAVTTAPPPSR